MWARYGYNAPLKPDEIALLPDELKGCKTLNDIMRRKGKDWWKVNGSERDMVFSLDKRSSMMSVLRTYIEELGLDVEL